MTDIQEGDQVSRKYGQGSVDGTVAEVKTSGEITIESKGKDIKVNDSEENPSVHIAREDSDVVKSVSASHKEANGEEGEVEPIVENQDEAQQRAENSTNEEDREDKASNRGEGENSISNEANGEAPNGKEQTNGYANGHINGHVNGHVHHENGDKMDTSKDNAKTEVGDKRPREEDDDDADGNKHATEEEQAEAENGKQTKKARIDAEEIDAKTRQEEETFVNNGVTDEATPKKKAGRPKKSEPEATTNASDTIGNVSARTRSKA